MKIVAVDVGFSDVKYKNSKRGKFPSVVGTPIIEVTDDLATDGDERAVRFDEHKPFIPVGETAIDQSQYTSGSRDPEWVLRDEWYTLMVAALGAMFDGPYDEIGLVTGLPVSDWKDYHDPLKERLNGMSIYFQMKGRAPQDIFIKGIFLRPDNLRMFSASISLPVPVSPVIRMEASVWATAGRILNSSCILVLLPMKLSKPSDSIIVS